MRRIAANYVFPVSSPPVRNGIVVLDEEGRVTEVKDPGDRFREMAALVFYNGILIPSFVFPESGEDPAGMLERLFPAGGRDRQSREEFDGLLHKVTLAEAQRLGLEEHLGSLEKGKRPGVLLITPFDFEKWKPAVGAVVKKIVW